MSSIINNPPAVPLTPEEIVRQLRALREHVPDFTLLSGNDRRPLVRASVVSEELIHASINAIAASPPLRNALERDAETLRSEAELIGRWSEVVDELEAFRLGVTGSIRVRRHRLGGIALRVRQIGRQLVRYKENANLLPHLDAMKRAAKGMRRPTPAPPQPVDPLKKPQA